MKKSVKVLVPSPEVGEHKFDPGAGFGRWIYKALMWLFTPAAWRDMENYLLGQMLDQEYLQECRLAGENPDGSFTREFSANVTLEEALLQCDLDVVRERLTNGSIVAKLGDRTLGSLTSEQIEQAVAACQKVTYR